MLIGLWGTPHGRHVLPPFILCFALLHGYGHVSPKSATVSPFIICFALAPGYSGARLWPRLPEINQHIQVARISFLSATCHRRALRLQADEQVTIVRLWGTGHGCYLYHAVSEGFFRVNQLQPCLEAPGSWTNDDRYVSEASKNPVFVHKKILGFFTVRAYFSCYCYFTCLLSGPWISCMPCLAICHYFVYLMDYTSICTGVVTVNLALWFSPQHIIFVQDQKHVRYDESYSD